MHYYFNMARTDPQLNLRLPADLKEKLEEAATTNNRTLTSETVDRLVASFEQPVKPAEMAFLISRMEMRAAEAELDLIQMKAMLAETYWSLKAASMLAAAPAEVVMREIKERLSDWEATLQGAEEYIGDPTDTEALSKEMTDRLEAFNNAFDKTKTRYKGLDRSE